MARNPITDLIKQAAQHGIDPATATIRVKHATATTVTIIPAPQKPATERENKEEKSSWSDANPR